MAEAAAAATATAAPTRSRQTVCIHFERIEFPSACSLALALALASSPSLSIAARMLLLLLWSLCEPVEAVRLPLFACPLNPILFIYLFSAVLQLSLCKRHCRRPLICIRFWRFRKKASERAGGRASAAHKCTQAPPFSMFAF